MLPVSSRVLIAVCFASIGLLLALSKVPLGGFLLAVSVLIVLSVMMDKKYPLRTSKRREYKSPVSNENEAIRDSLYVYKPPVDNASNTPKRVIRESNYGSTSKSVESKNKGKRKRTAKPSNTPRKVLVMLQNDLNQALRLYEGVASRNPDKSAQWVWERVISDLERDRR